MIGKAGLAAVVVVTAIVSGRSGDLRALYDQMYPVSTLRRDALNLCHEADPTFIRAWRSDRVACYTSMPHAIALALGLTRPSNALAGLFAPFGGGPAGAGSLLAEAGLASQAASRWPALTARRNPAGPCRAAVAELAEAPAGQIGGATALNVPSGHRGAAGSSTLAHLGLGPRRHPKAAQLPVPGAAAPAPRASGAPTAGTNLTLLDTTADPDLGDMPEAPAAPSAGCGAPI